MDKTFKEFLQTELLSFGKYELNVLQLISIAIIFAVVILISRLVKYAIVHKSNVSELERGRRLSVFQLVQYLLWIIAILLVLELVGVKITLLLAGSAALLVGIGLGLQEVFKDFVCGVILLFDGTIRVGDVIAVDETVGRIRQISLRASELETREGIILIVPNSRFVTGNVVNWTHDRKLTRFSIVVGVAYGSDVEKVRDVLEECAKAHPKVAKEPEPFVFFSDFGDSQLTFTLLFYSMHVFPVERTKSDIRFKIDKAFRENGVTIPFPQRDVHFFQHVPKPE